MSSRSRLLRALSAGIAFPAVGLAIAGVAFWAGLGASEREELQRVLSSHAEVAVTVALAAAIALGIVAHALYLRYDELPRALADEIGLIAGPNPEHQIDATGPEAFRRIAAEANRLGARLAAAERDVGTRVASAVARLTEEKNRLAALMSELTHSVLVCNSEGRILLYNAAASALLDTAPSAGASGSSRVGLGRTVFTIIGRDRVAHARESIAARLARGETQPVARFVVLTAAARVLRAQMAPVMGAEGAPTGYVVMLEDVTRETDAAASTDALLLSLTEGSRAGLANVRAAADTLRSYPDMDADSQRSFIAIIQEEAEALSGRLERVAEAYGGLQSRAGPVEEIDAADLLRLAARAIGEDLEVTVRAAPETTKLWLEVDGYAFIAALSHVARSLRESLEVREIALALSAAGRLAQLDMCWYGPAPSAELLRAWEAEPLSHAPGAGSLRELLERRGGDAWCVAQDDGEQRYRIALPLSAAGGERMPRMESGRPAFYDFDLFNQAGQTRELDARRLADLAYTVFDTETTGLEPSSGDEIVSIGAVRIVNGRLLEHETFDQLIDAPRASSPESLAVHGIDSRRLDGQPGAEVALPRFHAFCEETVLVGHNAAFDMRFLQLKEAAAGVAFDHPVLDTLLLSAVLHPEAPDHSLEAIAARLGVGIEGRHTALGDAMVTARVFLRMIPLLAERGIDTLGAAREAAQRTLYARIVY